MPAPLLSLHGVTKRYGPVLANDAVDLDVAAGSIHAVLGENGAGKSTLMKLIAGVERPDAGRIEWDGAPVAPSSPAQAQRMGVGIVFQHFALFETLSVVQNVALVIPGRQADLARRIRDTGDRFGLPVNPDAMVHRLSVGERQRVEIIRCLMLDPRLLILDEPTSVLPPQAIPPLFDTLRGMRDRGMALLFISHKLGEIRDLCDTATILRGGRVVDRVDPRDRTPTELAQAMIGRDMPPRVRAVPRMPGTVRLSLEGVTWDNPDPFGTSLSDVSLGVRSGEVVGIAGISGNGQAEMAAILSGEVTLDRADAVTLMGRPAGRTGAADRRRAGLAFVPEDRLGRGAVPDMSLSDNTLLTAHGHGLTWRGFLRHARERAMTSAIIANNDVRTPSAATEAGALSGGNLQKFVMGREIALAPDVLVVAQPTWGVDVAAAAAIRARLIALRDAGCAVLVISEEIEELFEICDRMHVLHHGRLSPSLTTADVTPTDVGRHMIGAA
ncbi:ABC transporter ATP-binding protein [Jannaschia sp. LMIT008]|uniref:ABC transporter ATP-binding protein n=1 Tax=Jannaschia maritima TaxID=3032585 RepID=UPI00281246F8|nr:ABC transporter ATP-binding protein [Jannaschia sp. LMIT008]